MKKILLLFLCLAVSATFNAQTNKNTSPYTIKERHANSIKIDQKKRAQAKPAKSKKQNTINTKDPGTDAVLNSTTGRRNRPDTSTPSPVKDTANQRDGKVVKVLPESKKHPNTSATEKKRLPGSNVPSTQK